MFIRGFLFIQKLLDETVKFGDKVQGFNKTEFKNSSSRFPLKNGAELVFVKEDLLYNDCNISELLK